MSDAKQGEGDLIEVVFPVGFRAGQKFMTPKGDITIGPARRTQITPAQHEFFRESHRPGYFEHDDQGPTDEERYAATHADADGNDIRRAREQMPRPGTKAYDEWAQAHERESRAAAAHINDVHNRGKRRPGT